VLADPRGLLLYATFGPVPLLELREALARPRFVAAAVIGKLRVLPLVALGHCLPWLRMIRTAPGPCCLVLWSPAPTAFITFAPIWRRRQAPAGAILPLPPDQSPAAAACCYPVPLD